MAPQTGALTWQFWRHPALLHVCIVNFKDDKNTALRGVLWNTRGSWIEFRDCALLVQGQPPTKLDGDVIVPVTNIAFLQRLESS